MKSIWKKILVFVVLPFLLIYVVLSTFIIYQVYRTQFRKTQQRLYTLALFNEVNLKDFYDVGELSVQISATELETIDPNNNEARLLGEALITTRFRNPNVSKVWLMFESDAFDGKDALHREDYASIPSGQYIRVFSRDGDSWSVDEAMIEALQHDPEIAEWYTIPRDWGIPFTTLGYLNYGSGLLDSVNISGPVYRGNRIIGCVGLVAELDETTLGERIYPESVSSIFIADGRLSYTRNTALNNKTLEELGFDRATQIKEAMARQENIYLSNEYSGILNAKSHNYFRAVQVNGRTIYINTAVPQSDVWLNTAPVINPVIISLFISLVIFGLLLLYLAWGIAKPLKRLSHASETLAAGDLDIHIDLTRSTDEMGMITKSLGRMAEQFRVSKLLQQRHQNRFDIVMGIHYALFRSDTLDDTFHAVLTAAAEYFGIFKAALIFVLDESARQVAFYPANTMEAGTSEFFCHNQVVKLLQDKKHLTMNYGALKAMQLPFVDFNTRSLCILPLRMNDVLRGYIIMEGNEPDSFIHDDTTLLFLGDALSYILGCRIDWDQKTLEKKEPVFALASTKKPEPAASLYEPGKIPSEEATAFLEKARDIRNLDVDKGILLIGGIKENYTELLRITIKVIAEGMLKMRRFYMDDLPAFAIEVHGMKGALYSIGAEALGDEARQLEFAAKSDDAVYCQKNYPAFEEKLRVLSRNLAALFPRQERSSQKGSVAELVEVLAKAREACGNFDAANATALLAPLIHLKWDIPETGELLEAIGKDLENIEYDGAEEKITRLLDKIGGKEA
jgi:HAMP domain-containing protein/HPt (histidine-containing phosphotransfer) domain-containing protein